MLHAMLTALRRRRRDIAITRALGLTRRSAANSLVWQAVLTALVGVASGTLLGVIVGPMMWRIIATDLGVIVRPIVPVVAVALAAAIGLTIAVLLSLGPRWRAIHLPLTPALRSE
jgi:ABC-type lipoprotein release transport system permease subunit